MLISELFHSRQGEGRWTGVSSFFIRTSGCNLRCWFCDTPYTSWEPEGTQQSVESLVEEATRIGCEHVVITGGEPMLQPEVVSLTKQLKQQGHIITVETAGTIDQPVECDLMSISPKLPNSTPDRGNQRWPQLTNSDTAKSDETIIELHEGRRDRPETIRRLTSDYDYQLKFVVDTPEDIADIENYLAEFPHLTPGNIYLMPQGIDWTTLENKYQWISKVANERGWQVSQRRHIEWYGNRRGT